MEEILDLKDVREDMRPYYIVTKIYEIRDALYFVDEPIEYKSLATNLRILNYMTEINFVYSKGVILDQIKEITKVGMLMNYEVYLDPLHANEVTFLAPDIVEFKLKILF